MASLPSATPQEIGLNAARIEHAYALMQQWTAGPDAPWPAAAIAIGRRGRLLESRYFGRQGPEPDAPTGSTICPTCPNRCVAPKPGDSAGR